MFTVQEIIFIHTRDSKALDKLMIVYIITLYFWNGMNEVYLYNDYILLEKFAIISILLYWSSYYSTFKKGEVKIQAESQINQDVPLYEQVSSGKEVTFIVTNSAYGIQQRKLNLNWITFTCTINYTLCIHISECIFLKITLIFMTIIIVISIELISQFWNPIFIG